MEDIIKSEEKYEFIGKHLMANYIGCDHNALVNFEKLEEALVEACTKGKATVLTTSKHIFPPDGFSMLLLLAESHASIHTYPEYDSCFVDFFTCGTTCSPEIFNEVLKKYLKPRKSIDKIYLREETIKENHLCTK